MREDNETFAAKNIEFDKENAHLHMELVKLVKERDDLVNRCK